MAKADAKYTYSWFISLAYDQWARSTPWITDQIEANRKAGIISNDQVKTIWEHHDQIIQAKIDAKNKSNPPKIVQQSPPGVVVGSATATSDPSFLQKVGQGWQYIFDQSGQALGNAGSALTNTISIGNYLVIGGLIFIVIKIFKK